MAKSVVQPPTRTPAQGVTSGWRLVAQTTNAKVTRSYRDVDGAQVSHDDKVKGTPSEVRMKVAALAAQEHTELQWAHTCSTYVFDTQENTNHGITQQHREKEVWSNGFGEGAAQYSASTPLSETLRYDKSSYSGDPEVDEEGNPVSEQLAAMDAREAANYRQNNGEHGNMYLAIAGVGILAAAAVVIAILVI